MLNEVILGGFPFRAPSIPEIIIQYSSSLSSGRPTSGVGMATFISWIDPWFRGVVGWVLEQLWARKLYNSWVWHVLAAFRSLGFLSFITRKAESKTSALHASFSRLSLSVCQVRFHHFCPLRNSGKQTLVCITLLRQVGVQPEPVMQRLYNFHGFVVGPFFLAAWGRYRAKTQIDWNGQVPWKTSSS